MRLIDADIMRENLEWCKSQSGRYDGIYWDDVIERLDIQPTVDAVPVVHGQWIGMTNSRFYGLDEFGEPIYREGIIWKCSVCYKFSAKRNYCPNCGAKMDLEEQKCTFTDTEH